MSEFHFVVPIHLDVVINTYVRILMLIPLLRIEKADSCGILTVAVRCQSLMFAVGSLAVELILMILLLGIVSS